LDDHYHLINRPAAIIVIGDGKIGEVIDGGGVVAAAAGDEAGRVTLSLVLMTFPRLL
jgi:hypothetical protein